MVKVCQVTSFRLVCSSGCSHQFYFDCTSFFSVTASEPMLPSLSNYFSVSLLHNLLHLCTVLQVSEGHGSPAHSRSGSIRSVASCDGGAAVLRAPGSAESSPRRTLHPTSTAGALQDGQYSCTLTHEHTSVFATQAHQSGVGVSSLWGVCGRRFSFSCSVEPVAQCGRTQTSCGPWVRRQAVE